MLTHLLARMSAGLPSSVKYKLKSLRRPYTSQGYLSDEGDLAVEAKSIDYLVEKELLPAPDVIKIDVEGHEAQVLRGARNTISSCKPIILCDYNDNQTFSLVQDVTVPFGYEVTGDSLVTAIPTKKSNHR